MYESRCAASSKVALRAGSVRPSAGTSRTRAEPRAHRLHHHLEYSLVASRATTIRARVHRLEQIRLERDDDPAFGRKCRVTERGGPLRELLVISGAAERPLDDRGALEQLVAMSLTAPNF